jgi:hypothetical protein
VGAVCDEVIGPDMIGMLRTQADTRRRRRSMAPDSGHPFRGVSCPVRVRCPRTTTDLSRPVRCVRGALHDPHVLAPFSN